MKFLKINYSTLQRMVRPLDKYIKNKKKREIIEETIEKLDMDERDMKNLEMIRKEVWEEEKEKLKL
jgi:hypothetical protein